MLGCIRAWVAHTVRPRAVPAERWTGLSLRGNSHTSPSETSSRLSETNTMLSCAGAQSPEQNWAPLPPAANKGLRDSWRRAGGPLRLTFGELTVGTVQSVRIVSCELADWLAQNEETPHNRKCGQHTCRATRAPVCPWRFQNHETSPLAWRRMLPEASTATSSSRVRNLLSEARTLSLAMPAREESLVSGASHTPPAESFEDVCRQK